MISHPLSMGCCFLNTTRLNLLIPLKETKREWGFTFHYL